MADITGYSCKRCGGLYEIGSVTCPYCGGINDSFIAIMRNKPLNISFIDKDKEYTLRVRIRNIEAKTDTSAPLYVDDGELIRMNPFNDLSLIVEASVIPIEVEGREGLYMTRRIGL